MVIVVSNAGYDNERKDNDDDSGDGNVDDVVMVTTLLRIISMVMTVLSM